MAVVYLWVCLCYTKPWFTCRSVCVIRGRGLPVDLSVLHEAVVYLQVCLCYMRLWFTCRSVCVTRGRGLLAGLSVLHEAVLGGHVSCVDLLLSVGADINKGDDRSGRTPLQHAAETNNLAIIEVLVNQASAAKCY